MPLMNTKTFPKVAAKGSANAKAAKSMRQAFGKSDEDEAETPSVGHTKLDEDQEAGGFASRMSAAVKRRLGR